MKRRITEKLLCLMMKVCPKSLVEFDAFRAHRFGTSHNQLCHQQQTKLAFQMNFKIQIASSTSRIAFCV